MSYAAASSEQRAASSEQRAASSEQRAASLRSRPWGWTLGLVLILSACQSRNGSTTFDTSPSETSKALTVKLFESSKHDLGVVSRGERSEFAFQLRNGGDSAIELGPVQTSCECLAVTFDANRIEAWQTVAGTIVLDFRKDPKYTGGLLLTAEASTVESTSRKAFALRLSADVK